MARISGVTLDHMIITEGVKKELGKLWASRVSSIEGSSNPAAVQMTQLMRFKTEKELCDMVSLSSSFLLSLFFYVLINF